MNTLPTTPTEAANIGSKFYLGKPCPKGHDGLRYEAGHRCVECARATSRNRVITDEAKRAYAQTRRTKSATASEKSKRNSRVSSRLKNDSLAAFICATRKNMSRAYDRKGIKKQTKTEIILGCSFNEFRAHLERQFLPGMTWENRSLWHIDHIVPLATAKTVDEVTSLCHHTNLRPLWKLDNIAKGGKQTHLI